MKDSNNIIDFIARIMVAIFFLFLGGLTLSHVIYNLNNFNSNLIRYIIMTLFFFAMAILFIITIVGDLLPDSLSKKSTLYLKSYSQLNDGTYYAFIDKKGKKFGYIANDNEKFEIGQFYYVLKVSGSIKEIIGISTETFQLPLNTKKESYWLNYYSPLGNFNDIFLLPIIYIIFIITLSIPIILPITILPITILLNLIPLFLIIYDLVYKIKRKKIINNINVDNSSNDNDLIEIVNDKNQVEIKTKEQIILENIDNNIELKNLENKALNLVNIIVTLLPYLGLILYLLYLSYY